MDKPTCILNSNNDTDSIMNNNVEDTFVDYAEVEIDGVMGDTDSSPLYRTIVVTLSATMFGTVLASFQGMLCGVMRCIYYERVCRVNQVRTASQRSRYGTSIGLFSPS